jgi:hypothetical protein
MHRWRWLGFLVMVLGVLTSARVASAQSVEPSHVRPDAAGLRELLTDAMRRSPTVRRLVGRLERLDLVVYVRSKPFAPGTIAGQLKFVGASDDRRYVLVEIGCTQSLDAQVAALGHELRHAVEIAELSWIRSASDMAAFYKSTGMLSAAGSRQVFESSAAIAAGQQVARELRDRANVDAN